MALATALRRSFGRVVCGGPRASQRSVFDRYSPSTSSKHSPPTTSKRSPSTTSKHSPSTNSKRLRRFCTTGSVPLPPPTRRDRDRLALLIDGDSVAPSSWASIVNVVREKGDLVKAIVFCPPQYCSAPAWTEAAARVGVVFEPVVREAGGAKDPNDMAIAMEAVRLATSGSVTSVALAVSDIDFVYVAQRLVALGHKTVAVIPEGSFTRLACAFEDAGADVAKYQAHRDGMHLPKKKMVLHVNGEGSIEDATADDLVTTATKDAQIAQHLCGLGYMLSLDDPLVPGLARFYNANSIGPLTVWPPSCSLRDAHATISEGAARWTTNPGDSVFVLPMANGRGSKYYINKYGSINCSRFVGGGGPFMLKDSTHLVIMFLERLGYLDNAFNSHLGEAIDIFCRMKLNRRALADIGLSVPPFLQEHSKSFLLHGALLSSRATGTWQLAPSDTLVRKRFVALKLISTEAAPTNEMFSALQAYVRERSLPHPQTYNGLVMAILDHMQTSRRELSR